MGTGHSRAGPPIDTLADPFAVGGSQAGLGKAATRAFQLAGIPPPRRGDKAPDSGKKKKKKAKQGTNAIVPYKQGQRLLLVGEGNFSFASALAKVCEGASGIDATAYDSAADVSYTTFYLGRKLRNCISAICGIDCPSS